MIIPAINDEPLISLRDYYHDGMTLSAWEMWAEPQHGAAMRDNRPPAVDAYGVPGGTDG